MKAIAIFPGKGNVHLVERSEPEIRSADEVKVKMIAVGICGTDREEARGGRADAPDQHSDLVIGHEMFGQVVEIGDQVRRVKVGDYAVFTVRRGCGRCLPCLMNRSDMCLTGEYKERGIKGLDGFQTEFVVDQEKYIVKVPDELMSIGVLCEPLAVAEKAIDEAIRVQVARLPDAASTPDWLFGRDCLVAGLGPVGLLAAMALRLRGANVYGLDIVDEDSSRPAWFQTLGGTYIDGRNVPADQVDEKVHPMELIFEATGVPDLEFNLLDALSYNAIYVLTGIPGGDRPLQIRGADLIRQLVLKNQVMIGSVNEARDHFQFAVDDLRQANSTWPGLLDKLITHRYQPEDIQSVFSDHPDNEIKAVVDW